MVINFKISQVQQWTWEWTCLPDNEKEVLGRFWKQVRKRRLHCWLCFGNIPVCQIQNSAPFLRCYHSILINYFAPKWLLPYWPPFLGAQLSLTTTVLALPHPALKDGPYKIHLHCIMWPLTWHEIPVKHWNAWAGKSFREKLWTLACGVALQFSENC